MGRHKETERLFLKLYDEHADQIFRHCYFRVSSRELAEDLTQESFMRVWDYLTRGNAIDNPRAFLYRIARNLIIDHYRQKKEMSLDALSESGFDPVGDSADTVLDYATGKQVYSIMKKLEPEHREVLALRYIDNFSIRDIAQIIDESENVVSVRIHRGIQKLKKLLTYGKPN